MTVRASQLIALALVASACAPATTSNLSTQPHTPAITRASSPEDQLRRDLRAIFTQADVDDATWSLAVKSLKNDELLFSMNSNRMQTPASNQKLITAAVAADRLGWDYRYTTKIYTNGTSSTGDLDGDLVIASNGDPTLNPRHPERWTVFDSWAQQLYEKGVRRINGRLIGDDNAFAEPGWGIGWAWDDLIVDYGAAVGGLQYNENAAELSILPGSEAGDRARLTISPEGTGLVFENDVTTVGAGQAGSVSLDRRPGSNRLKVSGRLALGAEKISAGVAVPNPTIFYLNAFRDALARNGITLAGEPLDIDDTPLKSEVMSATLLLEDRSPSLISIIDANMKWSLNEYSETLLRSLAGVDFDATAEAGLEKVDETLKQWGIAKGLYVARDGSGLSRNDYVAPDALIGILTHVWNDARLKEPFRSTLAQAAVSGTLARRMKETPAAARVWAKTGSMSNVRSLSGYLMTLDNEPIVFSFMSTGFQVPSSRIDAVMDEALVRLVKFPRALHEE